MNIKNRKLFLFISAIHLVIFGSCSVFAAEKESKRPNIVFIFTDDHSPLAISAYGSKINKTPNLDRIANEGMRFDRCFVTNAICGPSRAVIQTGKHSHLNGFFRNGLSFNGNQQTFPKLLQKAGYQTAVVGKWHLKSEPQGYDYHEVLIGQGPYYNPPMMKNGKLVKHTGYTTDIITDLTLEWLKDKRDPNKPFMLMYQHKAPHRNWQPGPDHLTKYDGETIPEPDTLFYDYDSRVDASRQQTMTIKKHLTKNDLKLAPPRNLTSEQKKVWDAAYGPKNKAFNEAKLEGDDLVRWKYQRYIKDYLRCVDSVDDNIGKVLKYLDDNGLSENTIVIYSSDQGWYLGEYGWYDKRWMYDYSLRMPLLIKWPGVIKKGSVNNDIVSNLDFAQTFLDMAGAELPKDMQGESLVPLMKGNAPEDWRTSFYYHYYEFPGAHSVKKHCGVRTDDFKLISFYSTNEWEFYDLRKDPTEIKNQYNNPEYKKVIAKLKTELKDLKQAYQVPEQDPTFKRKKKKKISKKK